MNPTQAMLLITLAALTCTGQIFRVLCFDNPLTIERADPIVNPGAASSHIHTIYGANAFSKSATNADLKASQCTTCNTAADMSAYWFPTLYHDTGSSFKHIKSNMAVYYINYGDMPVEPFPEGFRAIAGDKDRRNGTDTLSGGEDPATNHILEFQCINYEDKGPVEQPLHPTFEDAWKDGNCRRIRARIYFPRCWDGKNVDSDNHKGHVAYPLDGREGTKCPDTHPKLFIVLRVETEHYVEEYKDQKEMPKFMYSMGDYSLNGLHADFMNGWDTDVFNKAVTKCNTDNFEEKCDVFTAAPGFKTFDNYNEFTCNGAVSVPEEVVGDAVAKLPLGAGFLNPGGSTDFVAPSQSVALNVTHTSASVTTTSATSVGQIKARQMKRQRCRFHQNC